MKILILAINFAPEQISTGLYTTGLAEAMARKGDRVEVVTAQPYYPAWKVFDGYPRFWWKRAHLASGVNVIHCPHYVPARPSGAKRILHHASFVLTALPVTLWKAFRFRPDLVFIPAPALLPAPLALLAARLSGAKAWLHIQDFEVKAAFATGLLKEKSFIGRMAKQFDAWIHRRFDRVSSISEPMLEELHGYGIKDEQIFALRNWANLQVVRPMSEGSSPYRAEFGITTPHVALYSGNIANKQGLDIIPELAREVSDRKDLTFAICGDGPFLPELKRLSEGLENVRFFPLQPIERLGDLLGLATVHLLPQIAGVEDLVLPSKLTNMLASGRPVLATTNPGSSLARAVEGCGAISPPGDAPAMARALRTLLDDPALRQSSGEAARARAVYEWDADQILDRFRLEALTLTETRSKIRRERTQT